MTKLGVASAPPRLKFSRNDLPAPHLAEPCGRHASLGVWITTTAKASVLCQSFISAQLTFHFLLSDAKWTDRAIEVLSLVSVPPKLTYFRPGSLFTRIRRRSTKFSRSQVTRWVCSTVSGATVVAPPRYLLISPRPLHNMGHRQGPSEGFRFYAKRKRPLSTVAPPHHWFCLIRV